VIFEQAVIIATDTDVLNGTRLNSIPYNGTLTLQFSANLATAAAQFVLDIQLPNGENPVSAQIVAGDIAGADGVLDTRSLTQFSFPAAQGGHFTISLTETGTAIAIWRAVLRP